MRAFGLVGPRGEALAFEAPRWPKDEAAIRARLRAALAEVKPVARAPSVGEALGRLEQAASGGSRGAIRRALAELSELTAQAAYGRSKRAERARLVAVMVVVFGLGATLGADDASDDEERVRATRRAIDARLREG